MAAAIQPESVASEADAERRQRLVAALTQLENLLSLPAGWDSYGSPPIRLEAVARGMGLLGDALWYGAPAPQVCPVPGGGVQLEWQARRKGLEVEVLPDGSVQFLKDDNGRMDEGPLDPTRPGGLRELVDWLIAP